MNINTEKNLSPIGVFDSGVGGLTVAREIMRQLPNESIVYFGDTARVPYGSKSKGTIIKYSKQIVRFLKKNDPKMIFIYGQNDPWTAAGVTWLKDKKNIHVFVEPGGSHLARIGTMPEDQKQKVMSLLKGWLEE